MTQFKREHQSGLTIVELLIGLLISSFLLIVVSTQMLETNTEYGEARARISLVDYKQFLQRTLSKPENCVDSFSSNTGIDPLATNRDIELRDPLRPSGTPAADAPLIAKQQAAPIRGLLFTRVQIERMGALPTNFHLARLRFEAQPVTPKSRANTFEMLVKMEITGGVVTRCFALPTF